MVSSAIAPAPPPVNNARAAAWMLGSAMCFSCTTVALKILGARLPVMEVAFLRCLMSLAVLVPIVFHHGWGVFRTTRVDLHAIRVLCATAGITFGVYGISHLHLATAVSLGFTRPLFMIILAHFLLGERVHWRRGLATLTGFVGVLIVVGPSDFSDIPGDMAILISAAGVAGSLAVIRKQAGLDNPATIMAWYAVGTVIATSLPAFYVWQPPVATDLPPLAILAVLGSGGQYMLIRAFAEGEATVINPIDYSQIIFVSIIGFVMFAEIPTLWTALGAAVIMASTLYIVFREAKIKKAAAYPAA